MASLVSLVRCKKSSELKLTVRRGLEASCTRENAKKELGEIGVTKYRKVSYLKTVEPELPQLT